MRECILLFMFSLIFCKLLLNFLQLVRIRAPLSLERSTSASIVGGPEGSTTIRHVDPRAELQAATERNAREAREEKERADQAKADATRAAHEEADAAARVLADASAKAQAKNADKTQAAVGAHVGAATDGQAPLMTLRCAPCRQRRRS